MFTTERFLVRWGLEMHMWHSCLWWSFQDLKNILRESVWLELPDDTVISQPPTGFRDSCKLIINDLRPPRFFLCCKNCSQVSYVTSSSWELYQKVIGFLWQESARIVELACNLEVAEATTGCKKIKN